MTLIGHSGCGKSTLLNLIAGLTAPTTGALICAGREIAGPGPERAVVFQNHSLLPWMTCFENVHLGVERMFGRSETPAQLKARTHDTLALVGLTVLMLFDPSARNQVIAVLILTVGLIVAFFVLPGTRQRADSQ